MNSELKERIRERFREKPEPLFVLNSHIVPAATIWIGIRTWVDFFRSINLKEGTRVLIDLPPSTGFLYILFACFWEGIGVVLLPQGEDPENTFHFLKCSYFISKQKKLQIPYIAIDENFLPILNSETSENPELTTGAILFLATSGSSGTRKWFGFNDKNLFSVIDSHAPFIFSKDSHILSVLPWTHVFGLIIDLLSSVFYSSLIVRDDASGKDIEDIFLLSNKYNINHLSGVPLLYKNILKDKRGESFLKGLSGGVVGGAAVDLELSLKLSGTNLRVGYGQTEASPGITLGERGKFSEGYLGRPVGCETKISEDGELWFSGENIYFVNKTDSAFIYPDRNIWIETGDLVVEKSDGFYYLGRKNFSFKLPNGLWFFPEKLETEIVSANPDDIFNIIIFQKDLKIHIVYSLKSQRFDIQLAIPDYIKRENPIFTEYSGEWFKTGKGTLDRRRMEGVSLSKSISKKS